MELLIDDKIPYLRGQAERLGHCRYLPGAQITAEDVRQTDVLIVRTRTRVDRSLLAGSSVKLVVTATIGHDHIDKAYLQEAGIAWSNCPGCNAGGVAQYVRSALWIAALSGKLNVLSNGLAALPNKRVADWLSGLRESAPTVGVVGCGHVGSAVVEALQAEGCRILRCDPPKGEPHTLADVAREADVITLHTPLTTEGQYATYHLADAAFFESVQRKPIFINAARGECMDTAAVLSALGEGKISGAIIDTWEHEPHISPQLLQAALLATPHIAGYSADGKANASRMALEAVARHFGRDLSFDIAAPALPEGFDFMPEFGLSTLPLAPHIKEQLRRYNPLADTLRLRQQPECFEQQRGNYPLRRE